MSKLPLQLHGPQPRPSARSDASRNRQALLDAAHELIESCGAHALTMDNLASRAKVGKGTAFRHFGSRGGLMMTLISEAEADFQRAFMFGPPPLGPGAPALERLISYGVERIHLILKLGQIVVEAENGVTNRHDAAPAILSRRHLELLLTEAGVTADAWVMAANLAATLEAERILNAVERHKMPVQRLIDGWKELVTRLVMAG
ncbi:TetR/AcrR family transcriptional regulator [Pseudarthrobacter sp. J1738]|uniref:TetR/AcrR family transcriptional regulator n=1 Tax=unclassified Pseudarthrobacter TaxID=2647000 RepID=UPI003D29E387